MVFRCCYVGVPLIFRAVSLFCHCCGVFPCPAGVSCCAISLEFCCFVSVPCSVFWRFWFYSMPPPTITHQMPARTVVVCERINWQLLPVKLRFLLQICMRISRSYWTLPSGIGMWLDLRQRKKLVKFLHLSLFLLSNNFHILQTSPTNKMKMKMQYKI